MKLTKCEFQRALDAAPFPAKLPRDLKPKQGTRPGRKPSLFGVWLHEHNHPEFVRRFDAWRAQQLNKTLAE